MLEIPVFVINLPKDKNRREFVEKQLSSAGLKYEFVDGVYGDDERVTVVYDEELAKKEQGKPLTRGEKGCAFSHRSLYERIVNENISCALILEDDVILPENFKNIITKEGCDSHKKWEWLALDYQPVGLIFIINWLKASFVSIKKRPASLFYILMKVPYILFLQIFEGSRSFLAKRVSYFAGPRLFLRPMYRTGAYMITKSGAEKMLKITNPLRLSADRAPNQARMRNGLKYLGYVPVPVDQEQTFDSNTQF